MGDGGVCLFVAVVVVGGWGVQCLFVMFCFVFFFCVCMLRMWGGGGGG